MRGHERHCRGEQSCRHSLSQTPVWRSALYNKPFRTLKQHKIDRVVLLLELKAGVQLSLEPDVSARQPLDAQVETLNV